MEKTIIHFISGAKMNFVFPTPPRSILPPEMVARNRCGVVLQNGGTVQLVVIAQSINDNVISVIGFKRDKPSRRNRQNDEQ